MDKAERDFLWSQEALIPGTAFRLNDPVHILRGTNAGSGGSVISLLELDPEPRYLVELGQSGKNVELNQSDLVSALAVHPNGTLASLQKWYAAQADDDWEHSYGLTIGTLDNPGWCVEIDISDTPLESRPFAEAKDLDPKLNWIRCWVEGGKWRAACGPHMLERALQIFLDWANAGSG
jgi:hypothetical protein